MRLKRIVAGTALALIVYVVVTVIVAVVLTWVMS